MLQKGTISSRCVVFQNNGGLTVTEALAEAVARLHNIERAQERLGVGRSKIFELIASGELRSVRVGRRRLVPEQAIRDFVAQLDKQAGA
jgi:excisionase family DNA binding protein